MDSSISKNVWVIVGNSSRVRLFCCKDFNSSFEEIKAFVQPEARLKEQQLISDSPGRTFDSIGKGRHAKGQEIDVKKQQRIEFAREIAEFLEQSRIQYDFNRLALIASPEFLGDLRSKLSTQTNSHIVLSLAKDLTSNSAEAIQQHVENLFERSKG